jgi:hypothetical protein
MNDAIVFSSRGVPVPGKVFEVRSIVSEHNEALFRGVSELLGVSIAHLIRFQGCDGRKAARFQDARYDDVNVFVEI